MKMTKMTALLLAAAMALTACGSTAAVSSEAAASAAAAPEVTASPEEAAVEPAAAESAVTYPLTVTDQLGREVTIETEPKTLASGYYISTSLLIALGVQDELVGVEAKADKRTIYSLSAPELQSLPSIGTAKEFDLEGCAALTPDLVIVPAKLKDSIPQMEELGLTVLAVKPEDQDKLYGAIDLLAQATNTVARGEELKS
ncbi:MAG: ABC transporter substrate-binding protein, partial [Gemmiger sp.]